MDLMKVACDALAQEKRNFPEFKAGDTVTVAYKIKEVSAKGEAKERIQKFRGIVLQKRGAGISKTFTVRKMSNGIGVERIFPFDSPFIDSIEVNKVGKVRRARIYYLRGLTGKKARIKEKKRGASAKVEVPVTE
ncbi:MAG: 50S ribosomal protein L19 [Bacteroidales bacterium]|jgi:large subunit ribosomal protein L19|nr:50S ribosomal protein L19 [Bacteroidales bacterium]MBR3451110.1 50S ribosomal protein L19 [Bacteroidales bacterium]